MFKGKLLLKSETNLNYDLNHKRLVNIRFRFEPINNHRDLDLIKCKTLPFLEGFVFSSKKILIKTHK